MLSHTQKKETGDGILGLEGYVAILAVLSIAAHLVLRYLIPTLQAFVPHPGPLLRHPNHPKNRFSLRSYGPAVLVAETAVVGERNRALKAGFQRLAEYIFGNKREKIAMTAPVFSDRAKGAWRTRFVIPARFTAATLPDMPDGVTAAELPARRMAVVRFAGLGSGSRLAEQEKHLRGWLTARGLEATGDVVIAFYNSPFVAPPFRRNEVMIPVG